MFLLTEGTLFFLDLALSARIHDQKPSLSSVVQKWVDGVAAATDDSDDGANTGTGASSTLYGSSPVYPCTTVCKAPHTSSRLVASKLTPQSPHVFSKTSEFLVGGPCDGFTSSHPADEKEPGASHYDRVSVGTSGMIVSSAGESDRCNLDLGAPQEYETLTSLKRKVDDTDIVPDTEPDVNADDNMDLEEPAPGNASQVTKMVGSTAAKRDRIHTPPRKRIRHDAISVPPFPAIPDHIMCSVPAACTPQWQSLQQQVDDEGYIIEAIKRHSEYTNRDLPVPCDQRWSHSFVSTVILWYGVQENVWSVPQEELASALQHIFNIVYPDVKYRVSPAGSVFAITMQRINEWRSSFGSSALAMMLHFFSTLEDNDDIHSAAEFLATDFRFLREDPDSTESSKPFRSAFLLMLLGITHLGDIAAFVDVPGWDTQAMAAGKGGEGVIAIASAALERALRFVCDGTLDVDQALAETPVNAGKPMRTNPGVFQKTVLDTLAGRDAPTALQFSSTNWSGPTAAYRESVRKRGTMFVQETFAAAQARRRRIAANADSEAGVDASEPGVPDPRALL